MPGVRCYAVTLPTAIGSLIRSSIKMTIMRATGTKFMVSDIATLLPYARYATSKKRDLTCTPSRSADLYHTSNDLSNRVLCRQN